MRTMKKFAMLLTILVGTSLAVYAAVIVPLMRNLSVSNITSTTARIHVECKNTATLLIYAKSDVVDDYHLTDSLTVSCKNSGRWIECEFTVGNMQPDTPYYIKIEAIGFEDPETGDKERADTEFFLRTALE